MTIYTKSMIPSVLLLLALAAFSVVSSILIHPAPSSVTSPVEQFALPHRPYVPPNPDMESQSKSSSMLQLQYVEWATT